MSLRAALLFLVLASGCAPLARPAAPPARMLRGPEEVDAAAALLRLEDRRELDLATLERTAASLSPELRRRAALALGRIRDARGLPLLLRLVGDADTAVAATAAFGAGQLGDTTAVDALLPLLGLERAAAAPTVAGEAALALARLRAPAGRRAVAAFLRETRLEGSAAREAVGRALLAAWRFPRDPDLAPITRWTDSPDPELRWRAVYALTRRATPAATPLLLRLSSDPDWRARSFAVRGLAAPLADSSGVGTAAAEERLVRALGDPAPAVRINAARTLGTHPSELAVAALRGALTGADAYLATAAAEALGRIGRRAAATAPALRGAALDTTRTIMLRSAALQALAEVAPAHAGEVARRLAGEQGWRARAAAARAYGRIHPGAAAELTALVRDADPRVAAAAVEAAAGEGTTPTTVRPLLLEALCSPDVGVRTAALGGLARLADTSTVGAVLDAYARARADTLNDAALAALDALAALRGAGARVSGPFLGRFPRSPDALVRQRTGALFGDTATRAWGPALPVEPGRDAAEYRRVVRELVVPALAGRLPRARITTASGEIELRLFAADAPLTVLNFLRLAQAGYFDGQEWPRVVPNFVIQGGDPRGDTSGGPGYAIRDEINRHPYLRGTLGMALSGPDTGGSQFFITHSPQPHLDGGYTVFGEVSGGQETVDRVKVGEKILRVRPLR